MDSTDELFYNILQTTKHKYLVIYTYIEYDGSIINNKQQYEYYDNLFNINNNINILIGLSEKDGNTINKDNKYCITKEYNIDDEESESTKTLIVKIFKNKIIEKYIKIENKPTLSRLYINSVYKE